MKNYFELAKKYQKKYKLKMNGDFGQDDETDAFRHAFASSDISIRKAELLANAGGLANEIFDALVMEQTNERQNMDLYNNSVGRDVAKEIKKEYGNNIHKNINDDTLNDLIAEKIYKKMKSNQMITEIDETNPSHYTKNLQNNTLYGHVEKQAKVQDTASRQEGESRIDYFTRRIRESMDKSSQKTNSPNQPQQSSNEERKTHSLKDVLASQKEKLEGIKEKIFNRSMPLKRMHKDVPKDYQNKYLEDKKIFTKEEIQTMSNEDKKKYSQAIKYQNDTIGVPDEKQAEKMSKKEGSGLIKVSGYTRRDGTVVKSYYRSR
ncbi:MAG: hypothetical protein KHX03_06310 [Clostridium sp.]|nr:hypothetical protein [Clostridium sp.]